VHAASALVARTQRARRPRKQPSNLWTASAHASTAGARRRCHNLADLRKPGSLGMVGLERADAETPRMLLLTVLLALSCRSARGRRVGQRRAEPAIFVDRHEREPRPGQPREPVCGMAVRHEPPHRPYARRHRIHRLGLCVANGSKMWFGDEGGADCKRRSYQGKNPPSNFT